LQASASDAASGKGAECFEFSLLRRQTGCFRVVSRLLLSVELIYFRLNNQAFMRVPEASEHLKENSCCAFLVRPYCVGSSLDYPASRIN